jgi:hypothetical protein
MSIQSLAPALAIAFLVSAAPPQDQAKEKKVRKLMELTGAADIGKQTMDGMMDQFSKLEGLPAGFVKKFKEMARAEDLVELVVPIHMKHLDEETIDAAIVFHQSEAGKKLLKVQGAIMKESMEAGQKWGEDLARKVLKALEADKDK